MQFVKPAITTISVGIAMSLGALLLAAGAKGKRMALPKTYAVQPLREKERCAGGQAALRRESPR